MSWKYGTFDCCTSCKDCLCAYFCPPCYNFVAAKAATDSTACGIIACCFPLAMCCVRKTAREKRNIDESVCHDCLCTYFCHCCSAIQIKREFD